MEEEIITQLGLLLSQLRYARRALEDIERSTSRYGGVTFAVALAAGPRFGEPPLLSGALKVYVTNISDLTIARGTVGLLEGIMGGIGRFFGGLVGGAVGGVIGGVSLWVWVGKLQEIVKGISDILDRLGVRGGATGGTPGEKGKTEGTDWVAAIERLDPMIKSLTALFDAAARGPETAGKSAAEEMSKEAADWAQKLTTVLSTATEALTAVDKVVKALTLFVPILIGALATLLVRLDNIKLAILDLLQFALRITLLLRGVVLVTIYDTVSALAKLGVSILTILRDAVKTILDSVLAMLGAVFNTVEAFIRFAGSGLKNVMDGLLNWLVGGLGRVLMYIGDLRIFRLLTHLVQVLPSMLPALITLVQGGDVTIDPKSMKWLEDIREKSLPGPIGPALSGKLPAQYLFPDVGKEFLKDVEPFKKSLEDVKTLLPAKTDQAFDAARGGLANIDGMMQKALTTGEAEFKTKLAGDLKKVGEHANEMSQALTQGGKTAEEIAKKQEADPWLRAIAQAYENWLKTDGMKTMLNQISTYFTGAKASEQPTGAAAIPAAAVGAAQPELPKATVEIGEVVIDLKPSKPAADAKPRSSKPLSSLRESILPGYDEDWERGAWRTGHAT